MKTGDRLQLDCPRCRYALQGEVVQWSDAWPLTGRCPECGVEFRWRDVFIPHYNTPRWLVEHESSGRVPAVRTLGTVLRSLIPSLFWARVTMHHPIRPSRLTAYLLLLWLPVLLLALSRNVVSMREGISNYATWATLSEPEAQLAFRAAVRPFSRTSLGTWTEPRSGATYALPSPWDLTRNRWGELLLPLAMLLCGPACSALTFVVLPIARRRAKVRRAHVLRITVYAYGALAVVLGILFGALMVREGLGTLPIPLLIARLAALLAVATVPVSLWFWHAAVRRYLRMSRAIAVALSVWLIGWFAPFSIGSYVWYLL